MLQHPGSSWGFGALLKDTSVVVLKEERALVIHSITNNPCRTRDSNPQPLDYESDSLTTRPRLQIINACDNSFVQTVSPNPILCISGWNRIWITDCPHSISQLFISDLCVHKRFLVFTECALVSMVMPLRCSAYAKNNSNSNTVCNTDVLPSRLLCSIIFRLVRQRQKRRKLEYAALFHAADLRYF